jgi:hypothetical protein
MIGTIRSSLAATFAVAAVAAAFALPAEARGGKSFTPFVTDFPRAQAPPHFIPFVTDFGITARSPGRLVTIAAPPSAAPAASSGLDWGDVGIGAGLGIGFVVLAAATSLVLLRWRSAGGRIAGTAATR